MTRTFLFQPVAQQSTKQGRVSDPVTQMVVTNDTAGHVPLQVQAAASQSAHLTDWMNSGGGVEAYVDKDGNGSFVGLSATALDLGGGGISNATLPPNSADNAALADMPANTVKANPTAGSADPQDLSIGSNTVLGRAGGNIVAAQLATGQCANDAIDNTKLANMGANTVKANATAGSADPADLSVGTNTVVGRAAGNIVAAQVATGQIAANAADNTIIRDSGALSVIGRSANSSGDPADISASAASDTVLMEKSSGLSWNKIAKANIAANAVGDTELRQGGAHTLIGRSANSTGNVADISIANNQILQCQSSVLTSTGAPVSLDLSATTNDLGGASGAKGRPFMLVGRSDGDAGGSGLVACAVYFGNVHMDIINLTLPVACKVVCMSINVQHGNGSNPGNWRLNILNNSASTSCNKSITMSNVSWADNVTSGAMSSDLAFAQGDKIRCYIDNNGSSSLNGCILSVQILFVTT